jgi:hypothetical protein
MEALEAAFRASLLSPDLPPPRGLVSPRGTSIARRFAVYRNNVVAGLVRALEGRFPVVARLVGSEFFKAMARDYAANNPPRSPIMFEYGATFADFVGGFAPAAGLPYLADVARLEFARGRSFHAPDAAPLPAAAFAALDGPVLARTTLILHPSIELAASDFPVVSIWRAHQDPAVDAALAWGPEAALVIRPHYDVEVHLLPAGGHVFVSALGEGASFTRAAAAASGAPGIDPAGMFRMVIERRMGVGFAPARV